MNVQKKFRNGPLLYYNLSLVHERGNSGSAAEHLSVHTAFVSLGKTLSCLQCPCCVHWWTKRVSSSVCMQDNGSNEADFSGMSTDMSRAINK